MPAPESATSRTDFHDGGEDEEELEVLSGPAKVMIRLPDVTIRVSADTSEEAKDLLADAVEWVETLRKQVN